MDDGKHSFDKLIHVQNLLQVLLAQLRHLQHAESQKVVPNLKGEITDSECFTQYKTFQFQTHFMTNTEQTRNFEGNISRCQLHSLVLDKYHYSEIFDHCN